MAGPWKTQGDYLEEALTRKRGATGDQSAELTDEEVIGFTEEWNVPLSQRDLEGALKAKFPGWKGIGKAAALDEFAQAILDAGWVTPSTSPTIQLLNRPYEDWLQQQFFEPFYELYNGEPPGFAESVGLAEALAFVAPLYGTEEFPNPQQVQNRAYQQFVQEQGREPTTGETRGMIERVLSGSSPGPATVEADPEAEPFERKDFDKVWEQMAPRLADFTPEERGKIKSSLKKKWDDAIYTGTLDPADWQDWAMSTTQTTADEVLGDKSVDDILRGLSDQLTGFDEKTYNEIRRRVTAAFNTAKLRNETTDADVEAFVFDNLAPIAEKIFQESQPETAEGRIAREAAQTQEEALARAKVRNRQLAEIAAGPPGAPKPRIQGALEVPEEAMADMSPRQREALERLRARQTAEEARVGPLTEQLSGLPGLDQWDPDNIQRLPTREAFSNTFIGEQKDPGFRAFLSGRLDTPEKLASFSPEFGKSITPDFLEKVGQRAPTFQDFLNQRLPVFQTEFTQQQEQEATQRQEEAQSAFDLKQAQTRRSRQRGRRASTTFTMAPR